MSKCYMHTRHIPREHVKLDEKGKRLLANGLLDVLEGDNVKEIRDANVEYIETRLVWACLEKDKGVLDFSRVDRDIDRIEALGFQPALFVWPQHMPAWAQITSLKCLEHGIEAHFPSLWDPRLLDYYDHVYGAIAARYGDRIKFLYYGIYGDYGEYTYLLGVHHYIFSPEHVHDGKWCGDDLARQDFCRKMKEKYGTVDAMNAAWGTAYEDFTPDIMPAIRCGGMAELDRERWYAGCLTDFTDKVCAIIRKHFPNTRGAMPIGMLGDHNGMNKGQVVKICKKYNITPRWTGWAHLGEFGRSDSLCKRISSAARFYGTDFGLEAALELYEDNAGNAVYEALANGAVLIHNDPKNYARALNLYKRMSEMLEGEQPTMDTAVYYPLEDIWVSDIDIHSFADQAAVIRQHTDYELADSYMIGEGFLDPMKQLILTDGVSVPEAALEIIRAWVKKGGAVGMTGEAFVLESGEKITEFDSVSFEESENPIFEAQLPSGRIYYNPAENKIYSNENGEA